MTFVKRTLVSALVLGLALTGLPAPAHADPADDPRLTDNALYHAGPIARSTCAEKPIKRRNHVPTAKTYVTSTVQCLERAWSKHLAKAKFRFKKPKVALLTKIPARFCGYKPGKYLISDYCETNSTILIVLDRRLLNLMPGDLYIFNLTSSLYAEHLQTITGIESGWSATFPEEDDPGYEDYQDDITRRAYLQAFCFSGAFMASVYTSMPRDSADWKHLVRERQKEAGVTYGSARNIGYWMNRGFTSRNLKYCNTWSASASQVA